MDVIQQNSLMALIVVVGLGVFFLRRWYRILSADGQEQFRSILKYIGASMAIVVALNGVLFLIVGVFGGLS